MITNIRQKLIAAVTDYDRKQSTKRNYNPYALGHYFAAVDAAVEAMNNGKTPQAALEMFFNDRLLAQLVKAVFSIS